MTNDEIISLGENTGILPEGELTDARCQGLMFMYYLDRMVELGMLARAGASEPDNETVTEKGNRIAEFLIGYEFELNPVALKSFIFSDLKKFGGLLPAADQFVSAIIDIHTKGEDWMINQIIEKGSGATKEEMDEMMKEYNEKVEAIRKKFERDEDAPLA